MVTSEMPKAAGSRLDHLNIYFILGFAGFLRAILPIVAYLHSRDITIFYVPDTGTYVVPAQELIAHHRFFAHGAPEIIRTPGYPFLLIPGLLLHHLPLLTIALQVLLSCFTVYMVYRTAQLLFTSERIAIAAAALYAIEPLSVLYTGLIVTETLFTSCVMLWLYFLLRYLAGPRRHDLIFSGIFLAVSVYVRPIGYFLPVIIASGLLMWILTGAQRNKQLLLADVAAFLIVSMGLIGLWQIRNGEETGYFAFSAIRPIQTYFDKASSVLAAEQGISWYEMRKRRGYLDEHAYFALHPEQKTWSTKQRLEYMDRQSRDILLGSPLTYARIHFEGIARIMIDPGAIDFLKLFDLYPKVGGMLGTVVDAGLPQTIKFLFVKRPLVFWSSTLMMPLQLLLLLSACLIFYSGRLLLHPQLIAAMGVAAYFVIIAGGPEANYRYRHPAMPIVCIFAGYGLCLAWDRLAELRTLQACRVSS
jgi:4-amino-4-deoxy-L-arabinose transferase-like glycosyltransferase